MKKISDNQIIGVLPKHLLNTMATFRLLGNLGKKPKTIKVEYISTDGRARIGVSHQVVSG